MLLRELHHSTRLFVRGNKIPKIITTCRLIHFAPRERCVPVRATFTKDFYKRSHLLAAISVRHNSTTPESTSLPIDALSSLPDAPVPAADVAQAVIQFHANGEPMFSSIGLGGYGPIGLMQYFLELLHIQSGLGWTGTIIATSVILKVVLLPLYIKAHKNQINAHNHSPELEKLQKRIREEQSSGNILEASMLLEEQKHFIVKHGLEPLKTITLSTIQGVASICVFLALRGILLSDLDSLRFSGYWWFPDLTIPDPQYLLPIGATATIAVLTEATLRSSNIGTGFPKYMMRIVPLITLPLMIGFGSGLQLFWIANNLSTIIQMLLLKLPPVQKWFKIPKKREIPFAQNAILGSIKQWKEQVESKQGKNTPKYKDHLLYASRQPYIKTFKYNPKAQVTSTDSQKFKTK